MPLFASGIFYSYMYSVIMFTQGFSTMATMVDEAEIPDADVIISKGTVPRSVTLPTTTSRVNVAVRNYGEVLSVMTPAGVKVADVPEGNYAVFICGPKAPREWSLLASGIAGPEPAPEPKLSPTNPPSDKPATSVTGATETSATPTATAEKTSSFLHTKMANMQDRKDRPLTRNKVLVPPKVHS